MSEKDAKIKTENKENETADVEVTADINPEIYMTEADNGVADDADDRFDEEAVPVYDEADPENPEKMVRFTVADPESFSAGFYDWIRCILIAISIVVVCLTFVFRMVEVDGRSMENTLLNADKVIVTDMFYQPHNNDIVVISHATNYNSPIIKRVIATGGQTVKLDYDKQKIYVDGVELNEPYIKETTFSARDNMEEFYLPTDSEGNFVIPEGYLFVMGDNRGVSLDSRSPEIGLIRVEDVIGKAQFVVWPFSRFGNVYAK